jgi:hypothetical protein
VLVCLVPAGCYYALPLSLQAYIVNLFAPTSAFPLGLTFNSMLLHLLHGLFDVDPRVIGSEGFVRDGRTYAYFGIFPALLRLPLLALPNFESTDFTRLSCLVAVCGMALFKLLSVTTIWNAIERKQELLLLAAFVAAICFGAPQIPFLKPTVYQEPILWAGACAAAFVWLIIVGLTSERGYTAVLLTALAAAAGICLLTRVSTAIGLYCAFGLLWLQLAWRRRYTGLVPFVLPLLLLLGFRGHRFWNYQRWGSPFTLRISIAISST